MTTSASVEFIGADEVANLIRRLPETVFNEAKIAINDSILDVYLRVKSNAQGRTLNQRTGNLASALTMEISGNNIATLAGRVYLPATIPYGRIQETGGTIRAKNKYAFLKGGPYMNIPTEANMTGRGVTMMSSTQVFNAGGYIGTGPDGYGVYLGATRMFRFAKQITLRPRLGMRDAATAEVPTLLGRLRTLLFSTAEA
jgi:phage gpG-like protein